MEGSTHRLAARQHGVVAVAQLYELGLSRRAVEHRVATSRLWPVHRGVYAVGRASLSRHGRWMAAVLSCGSSAALSHRSAAALWEIADYERRIEVSATALGGRRRPGLVVHRRARLDVTEHQGIPVTTPLATLVDLATILPAGPLEAAVNSADKEDLVDVANLETLLEPLAGRRGVGALRRLVAGRTFTATDSWLERRFLRIVADSALPAPLTQQQVNGFRVDFWWPDLRLIVETDGLRYHRTPAQQAKDRVRDQTHAASGITVLRFTHQQVKETPAAVARTLAAVARRQR